MTATLEHLRELMALNFRPHSYLLTGNIHGHFSSGFSRSPPFQPNIHYSVAEHLIQLLPNYVQSSDFLGYMVYLFKLWQLP